MLELLREGNAGCPSDLQLDRLVAGEPATAAEAHLAGCTVCARRMEQRRLGFAAFPAARPQAIWAAIQRRPAPRRWITWRWPAALTTLAAAAVLLLVLRPRDEVRAKGGLGLHVHRLRDGVSQEAASGERFAAGDRLRFVVDLPERGYLSIVGVEATGRSYQAWPRAGEAPRLFPAGAGQLLGGAVALDGSTGRELLTLVHCRSSAAACTPPRCPPGCTATSFALDKAPAP
jgi:hypothetical protein